MPSGAQEVKFKRGQSGTMPADLEAGSLLVQTDTGDIFLDNTDSDRIQLGDSRKLSLSGGTMTGPINMGGQKITNLGNPTENKDAANKIFVDTAFQELESAINQELLTYLPLKGGTMVGAIDMGDYKITSLATPTDGTDAATKNYVDSAIGGITGFTVDSNDGNGYANYEALTSAHPTGEVGVFYLVVNPDSSTPNSFDEYFWTGTGYEKAGAFGDVDTSDLATKAELATKVDNTITINGQPLTSDISITNISGNAGTATKLQSSQIIQLTGDVSGSTTFDGSSAIDMEVSVSSSDRATNDADGNNIIDTYATKQELVQKSLIWGSFKSIFIN